MPCWLATVEVDQIVNIGLNKHLNTPTADAAVLPLTTAIINYDALCWHSNFWWWGEGHISYCRAIPMSPMRPTSISILHSIECGYSGALTSSIDQFLQIGSLSWSLSDQHSIEEEKTILYWGNLRSNLIPIPLLEKGLAPISCLTDSEEEHGEGRVSTAIILYLMSAQKTLAGSIAWTTNLIHMNAYHDRMEQLDSSLRVELDRLGLEEAPPFTIVENRTSQHSRNGWYYNPFKVTLLAAHKNGYINRLTL